MSDSAPAETTITVTVGTKTNRGTVEICVARADATGTFCLLPTQLH